MDIYNVNFDIVVRPVAWRTIPVISYGINEKKLGSLHLANTSQITIDYDLIKGSHTYWIDFLNKDYNDCQIEKNLDMAVIIESVSIEGLILDRFKWTGKYYPIYPEDYPDKKPVIESATYLGWNGKWVLPFSTPIFTWIHKVENLGWLYEP